MCRCHSHNGFLTVRGYEDAQRELELDEGLAVEKISVYIDKVGSVSASQFLVSIWDDQVIEEQYRRFHNGS